MSLEPAPIGYSFDSNTVACGDGPELLVYKVDGLPDWKQFNEGILVGVGVTFDQVITIDTEGRLCRWRRGDGELLDVLQVDCAPTGLEISPDGAVAIVTNEGPWVVFPGQAPRFISIRGTSAVCWGPDGNSMGVGTQSGAFAAVDPHSGASWGTVDLGGPVRGAGWSTLGDWVVTYNDQLATVQGDGQEITRLLTDQGGQLGRLAVSQDGLIVASILDGQQVALFELHQLRRCGELGFRRSVGDLRFGAGHWLAVGLDDADVTFVEVVSGASKRTEPHKGRGRSSWRLDNQVDAATLRGALALHRAGGEPIAQWVAPPESEDSGCLRSAAIVGCATIIMTLLCAGCAGGGYYLQLQGYF